MIHLLSFLVSYHCKLTVWLNIPLVCVFVIPTLAAKPRHYENDTREGRPCAESRPSITTLSANDGAGRPAQRAPAEEVQAFWPHAVQVAVSAWRLWVWGATDWPLNIITAAVSGGEVLFWKRHSHQDRTLPVTTSGPAGYVTMLFRRSPIDFRIHCRSPSFSLHLQQISRWVNPAGTAREGRDTRSPVGAEILL